MSRLKAVYFIRFTSATAAESYNAKSGPTSKSERGNPTLTASGCDQRGGPKGVTHPVTRLNHARNQRVRCGPARTGLPRSGRRCYEHTPSKKRPRGRWVRGQGGLEPMIVARRFIEVVVTAEPARGASLSGSRGGEESPPARPDVWQDGFETAEPTWQREYTDADGQPAGSRPVATSRPWRSPFGTLPTGGDQRHPVFRELRDAPRLPITDDLTSQRLRQGQIAVACGFTVESFCPRTSTRRRRPPHS